jgi:hypothetical protein
MQTKNQTNQKQKKQTKNTQHGPGTKTDMKPSGIE